MTEDEAYWLGAAIKLAGSKVALAEMLGINPITIYYWQTNVHKPKAKTMQQIKDYVGEE